LLSTQARSAIDGEWSQIYVIDFERSTRWLLEGGNHISFKSYDTDTDTGYYGGRVKYMSLNAHNRHELSRRDDLESLWYMVLDLTLGGLPWDGRKKSEEVLPVKLEYPPERLCNGHAEEQLSDGVADALLSFIGYVRGLRFEEEPNYQYMRNLFG